MNKLIVIAACVLTFGSIAYAATPALTVPQGGTGVGTLSSSQLLYGAGAGAVKTVATTTASCSGSASCTPFTVIGSSPVTISATGGSGGSGTATTSFAATWPITLTTSSSAITYGFNGLSTTTPWTAGQLAQVVDGGTVSSVATSSLFTGATSQLPYFSGTNTLVGTSTLTLSTSGSLAIGSASQSGQLVVTGNSTLFGLKNSAGTTLVSADNTGSMVITDDGSVSPSNTTALAVRRTVIDASGSSNPIALNFRLSAYQGSASVTTVTAALMSGIFQPTTTGGSDYTIGSGLGAQIVANYAGVMSAQATVGVTNLTGAQIQLGLASSSPTGTVSSANSIVLGAISKTQTGTPAVTFSTYRDIQINDAAPPSGMTINSQKGIAIAQLTSGGVSNYLLHLGGTSVPVAGNWSIFNESPYQNRLGEGLSSIGLGTATPANQLDIGTPSWTTAKTADFAAINVSETATSTTAGKIRSGIRINSTGTWSGTNAKNIGVYVESVTGGTNNYDAIFNGGGNVGIGTGTPSSKLAVSGSATIGADYNVAAPANGLLVEGNVGIGITSPTSSFEVAASSTTFISRIAVRNGNVATSGTLAPVLRLENTEAAVNQTLDIGFGGTNLLSGSNNTKFIHLKGGSSSTGYDFIDSAGNHAITLLSASATSGSNNGHGFALRGLAGQAADLFNISSSTGTSVFKVSNIGDVTATGLTTLGNASTTQLSSSGNFYLGSTFTPNSNVWTNPTGRIGAVSTSLDGVEMKVGGNTTSSEFRFLISDETAAGPYLAVSMPASTNTGTLFGQTRGNIASVFTNVGSPGRILALGTVNSNAMLFGTANTERMRIDASGNVGIGTTTPNWLLQAAGTRPSIALSDTSAGANLKHWLLSSMGGNLYIGTSTDSYGTSSPAALTITNAGFMGIGTTSPVSALDIGGAFRQLTIGGGASQAGAIAFRRSGGNITGFVGWNSSTETAVFSVQNQSGGGELRMGGMATNGFTTLYANNAEVMRLTGTNVGIASSSPAYRFSVNSAGSDLYIDNTGMLVAYDVANNWQGRVTPTRNLSLTSGTTTTWTATTSGAYIPQTVAPFAGTVRQVRCYLDASFLGVEIDINGTAVTPSYFVASTTVGKVAITGGNTFSAGDRISAKFGTTTSATTKSASCTLDITETP